MSDDSGIDDLLRLMVQEDASDLFLKVGARPAMRMIGKVHFTGDIPLSKEAIDVMCDRVASPRAKKIFEEEGDADCSYEIPGLGRFRVNIYHQRGTAGMVLRYVKNNIPGFHDLLLPIEQMTKLSSLARGLVLVTGITGSGKSTTLASMLQFVNDNYEKHIVTVEDPIEFNFIDNKSIFDQRELGVDTKTFASALKSAMRQSPDIIMLGEMRDLETVEAAISAAETGHLVFSTLHTLNASQTVDRIINFFPPHQHEFLKLQLSQILEGVISQRLIPTQDEDTRVPTVEILMATPTVKELLLAGKTRDIDKALTEGKYYGTQTFNQSLMDLLAKDYITLEDALNASDSPDELKIALRGINKGGGNFMDKKSETETQKRPKINKGFH